MNELTISTKSKTIFFWLFLFVGISLRLWISTLGHNFDLDSYWIVSDAVVNGKSVYAETTRYNYGPIWCLLLGCFRKLIIAFNIDNIFSFHILIVAFLTFVDAIITLIIKGSYGARASLFFFLNPVSILITGYHSQFDNFAILIALAACSELSKSNNSSEIRRTIFSMLLLGLSLATKHICLFFPLWLWWAYRDASVRTKTSILVASYGIFGLLFLPFAFDPNSISGIVKNVVKYNSIYGNGFITQFLNLFLDINAVENYFKIFLAKWIFILITIISGVIWVRKVGERESRSLLFIYLITMVAFTSSMTDQYLAIPIIALSRYNKHIAAWLYTLAATIVLLCSPNNIFSERFLELKFIGYPQAQIWLVILLVIVWRQSCSERICCERITKT